MKNNYTAFTICNIAYLHKALSLAQSYKNISNLKINIFLCDGKRLIPDYSDIAEIHWIEDLNIADFHSLSFKYDVTELTTSIKPYLAMSLLENNKKVIFFDPDTYILNSIDCIIEMLDVSPIVLTPHYVTPQDRGTALSQSDIGMMRFGSFNLGFFAISDDEEGFQFLEWWDKRCRDLCFFETQFGLSTDQKWISIAPCFFPNLHISFNLGLNVSFWNLHEREVSLCPKTNNFSINNKFDLTFFHFSSFDHEEPCKLSTRPFEIDISLKKPLLSIINDYAKTHHDYKKTLSEVNTDYKYEYMSDGKLITPVLRLAYASKLESFREVNLFDSNGLMGSFAKKNNLLPRKNKKYSPAGFNELEKNKHTYNLIIFTMRMLLKVFGPVRFANLSRLFVYLSSFRQNSSLWKL
tara:strand:- start:9074 stop:10297 length:1224 start_codon:yes stop_codon:yes gene_type:complete